MDLTKDKENIYRLIKWGITLIIVILLLQECDSVYNILFKSNKPTNDTIVVHKTDTLWAKDTIFIINTKFIPKPVYIHDTTFIPASIDTLEMYRFFTYKDTVKDNNIEFYRDVTTQGKTLKRNKISYKLKVPLKIIDSIKETIKVPVLYPPIFQLQGGLVVGSNIFTPEVGVSYKRHTLGLGYNLTNKQPIIRYSFVIFRK